MQYWIDRYGFWGYIQHFPVNPITIVLAVVIVGIIVIFVTAGSRKKLANAYLAKHPGSALMTFNKKKQLDNNYADNIRVLKLNGENANWFFTSPAVPALYLKPGENKLELYADWTRREAIIKMYKSEPVTLTLDAKDSGRYSLEYHIADKRYIFEEN